MKQEPSLDESNCIPSSDAPSLVRDDAAFEPRSGASRHPLASLIMEHKLISALAEALASFATGVELKANRDLKSDLERFARVFRDFADCVHHEKEESILLPFLTRQGLHWDDGTLAEVREEHRQEQYLIEVLCQAAALENVWNQEDRHRVVATALALAQFQRDHLHKENTRLFPAVTLHSSSTELERLEADLQTFDVRIQRHLPRAELIALAQDLIQRYQPPGALGRDSAEEPGDFLGA